ncbi:MAG: type III PLP-dependent enzyme [Geminicoccaceae bacterium]
MTTYRSAVAALDALQPDGSLYCLSTAALDREARRFLRSFPGETMYAVKCNPEPHVLETLARAGITRFDVASMQEIDLCRRLTPQAELFFMHPVKTVQEIAVAYDRYGVRATAVDHPDELAKVEKACLADPTEMTVFVRIATPSEALFNLSEKFGADPATAIDLLRSVQAQGNKVGLCFHVGSQVASAEAYAKAIRLAREIVGEAGVDLHALDVGGGFPAAYANGSWPSIEQLCAVIRRLLAETGLDQVPRIQAEPGRALVASAMSTLTRVELRKHDRLYIAEGVWGTFSESMTAAVQYPARLIRTDGSAPSPKLGSFEIMGVTCDCVDKLATRYHLPEDVRIDDWIEFGMTGAYSLSMRTRFNGFDYGAIALVDEVFSGEPEAGPLAA